MYNRFMIAIKAFMLQFVTYNHFRYSSLVGSTIIPVKKLSTHHQPFFNHEFIQTNNISGNLPEKKN